MIVKDFADKTVLVTGSSRGIGKAIATLAFERGASVITTSTTDATEADLHENMLHLQVDFSSNASTNQFLERLASMDKIDACINNAGINRIATIDDMQPEEYDRLSNVNLRGPYLTCKTISKLMAANGYGRIVNIASIWSVVTKPMRSAYSTTKAGLAGMTRALAAELAPANILVNAISPGFTRTDMTAASLSEDEIAALSEQIPVGRFAATEEIASLVLFLASDHNSYITGQNIVIDGGFSIV